jgi:hypothetical protein
MKKSPEEKILISAKLKDGTMRFVKTNEFRYQVYQMLNNLNSKLKRVVLAAEVTEAYIDYYGNVPADILKFKDAVTQALKCFVSYKLAFTEKQNKSRIYGSFKVFDPEQKSIYKIIKTPLRHKVLALVFKAVKYYGNRPVRCHDVVSYAKASKITEITQIQIVHNMWSLSKTGELKIVGRVQNDGFGSVLFLPAELNVSDVNSVGILTFTDLLIDLFDQMWQERIEDAKTNNRLIRPILTPEISKRLKQLDNKIMPARSNSEITSLLNHLSANANPKIRFIVQPNGMKLWVSALVNDEELDLGNMYSSNALKIVTALERAYIRAGKRPVNKNDIKRELIIDSSLALTGKMNLETHLGSLANRRNFKLNEKLKNFNFTEFVRPVGAVEQTAYFTPMESEAERDRTFIQLYTLKQEWRKFKEIESWNFIENCRLKSVQIGRIRLILQEAQILLEQLSSIESNHFQIDFDSLFEDLKSVEKKSVDFLTTQNCAELPEKVCQEVKGLTAKETNEFLVPFYPVAARLQKSTTENSTRISSRIGHKMRRISNATFKTKQSHAPMHSSEFLFEFTDLYIQTALQWGGNECRFQALIAKQELGTLRDERFIITILKSNNFEHRQIAIACLAFLQKGAETLGTLAIEDPVPEIRQASLWAYAFMNGEDFRSLSRQVSEQDSVLSVKKFAEQIVNSASEIEIWRI